MQRALALALVVAAFALACNDGGAHDGDAAAAGSSGDGPAPHGTACTISAEAARCDARSIETIAQRAVYWNEPSGPAPSAGWPAVILFQGSLYGPSLSWNVELPASTMYGGYYQIVLIAQLLEQGFVVVQPEAQNGSVWLTNSGSDYDSTADATFIPALLAQLQQGKLGHVDSKRLYATGISSGGYMTSRMAVSYPGTFRALAIESASYATCLGPLCNVPAQLPADHPPTLLLHGASDNIVPIATARAYHDALVANGIETKLVEDADAGHQWLAVAPDEITRWFLAH